MTGAERKRILKSGLGELYRRFDRSMISPDPLECVPLKGRFKDIELSAFIASAFAYGRANLIVRNVRYILDEMGEKPYSALASGNYKDRFRNFRYRFHKRADLVWLLDRLKQIYSEHETIENAFCCIDGNISERLDHFSSLFSKGRKLSQPRSFLVPSPAGGSACKRMNLFLRWMVRKDGLDYGIWKSLTPSELVIPLDVHVHRIAGRIGLVKNGSATFAKALELTENLKKLDPKDPLRYDFAICSLGKLRHCLKTPDPAQCKKCALKSVCTINSEGETL